MKKQKIFNFALSVTCAAVLSACGSSGGGSLAVENTPTTPSANANANTGSDNSAALTAAQKAAQEAAAKQAAAEQEAAAAKAAAEKAEQAAKDAAEKAKEDTAKAVEQALKDKEAADKKAAEDKIKKAAQEADEKAASDKTNPFGAKDQLTAQPDTTRETSFVGFKQTVKVKSNLATNQSTGTDSTSDVPTPMVVQNPHPSLDTIVVAEPKDDAGAARVYLEDFDTRFQNTQEQPTGINKTDRKGVARKADSGNRELSNIYWNQPTNGLPKGFNPDVEKQRKALEDAERAANTALDKAKESLRETTGKLVDIQGKINQLNSDWSKAISDARKENPPRKLTAAENASFKDPLNRLFEKKSELIGQETDAKQAVQVAESAQLKAASNLRLFTDDNGAKPTVTQKDRTDELGLNYVETKTKTVGEATGGVWIFSAEDIENRHQNFTEYGKNAKESYQVKNGYVYKGRDINGKILVDGFAVEPVNFTTLAPTDKEKVQGRTLDDTVAEVYGYRSKARHLGGTDGFTSPIDVMDLTLGTSEKAGATANEAANNLPLVNDYFGARLYSVQYGRVTTALNGQAATEQFLKKGVPLDGTVPTYVASFGDYGQDGTENHYFYRGINNVGAEELTKLKEDPKNGIITYEGHAVAYGLNNNYRGNVGIPTAIGAKAGFVSGNHATLAVNLGNGEVTGNIHNKWYDNVQSPNKLLPVNLVTFKGLIADNGNIAGTATREDNKTTGVFGATLFDNGKEVGGSFASDKHGKDEQWGGVFGGIRTPATPEAIKEAGMSVATDKKN